GLADADRLAAAAARARVRARALAAHEQVAAMADAAVRTGLGEALQVRLDLAAQLALHPVLLRQKVVDQTDLLLGEVLHASLRVDRSVELLKELLRVRLTDTIKVGQGDVDTLVLRQVHAGNTSHVRFSP